MSNKFTPFRMGRTILGARDVKVVHKEFSDYNLPPQLGLMVLY